ncbi:uncharacterized protein LOC131632337 [Vicia villosa]|uniref:uncharacterized protein LOC131632337 n=1 Tax=Vicia villosa TaxID=3911 RepID=UPI00273C3883|nr:uncharacterized protein LOC131632337 [Vicia villosa]
MTEREMIDMFTSTLSGHYYLACSASANFSEMVRYGERVEMGLKMGKIQLGASSNSTVGKKQAEVPQQQQQQGQRSSNDRYPPRIRPHRKIDPIPMTYAQVLQHLLKIEKITLRDAPNAPDTQSPNYNANARCAFHSGAAGHDTERCIALKNKQHLINSGIFPGCGVDCENCKSQPEGCADLKGMVQKLIDEGPLQFYRRLRGEKSKDGEVSVISIPYDPVVPICIQVPIQIPVSIPYEEQQAALMITVPGPIPYESEKAIPWHYGSDVYYYGTKEEGEPSKEKFVEASVANTDNFTGTGRITRSGRVFSPQLVQNNEDALAKAKGKQVVPDVQNSPIQSGAPDNAVSSKDEISVNQLEAVANNISAGNGLGFTDRDLPPEGRNHNKALHISMECKGTTLSRVLVDTGSSLNVLPKSALMRIDYAGVELRPTTMNQAIPSFAPIKDITNLHYLKMARFAVTEFDNKEGALLEFEKLIKGEYQSFNDGTTFRLTLSAKNRLFSHDYEAVIWESAFGSPWDLASFKRA